MPIKTVKTDLEWGDTFYLISDPDQDEYKLVGIIQLPGNQLEFILSYCGDKVTVYDFECTKERDAMKVLKANERKDDDEQET